MKIQLLTGLLVIATGFWGTGSTAHATQLQVKWLNDPLFYDSALNKEASYFTYMGGAQVLTFRRDESQSLGRVRVGGICCHKSTLNHSVFFLKNADGQDVILQIKPDGDGSEAGIFNVEGKRIAGPVRFSLITRNDISIARSKKHFLINRNGIVYIYDVKFNLIKEYEIKNKQEDGMKFSLSSDLSSAISLYEKSLNYISFNEGQEKILNNCNASMKNYPFILSNDIYPDRYYLLSYDGTSCFVDSGNVENYKLNYSGTVISAYSDNNYLYIITRKEIILIDLKDKKTIDKFNVISWYEGSSGKQPYINPMFTETNEFNPENETIYIQGGGNTGLFYIFKVKD